MAKLKTIEEMGKEVLESIKITVNDETGLSLLDCIQKQIPKRPDYEGDGYADGQLVYDTWICPNCGKYYEVDSDDYKYCPECGQRLDLTEVDTDDT